ncbi:tetratricopeptide repeat protein [Phenylobacterium deserti]|uniref:Uncharacterized protein n=1 Tax=Phenylobacterium deserti TaxID=1914756 RepID=A0A328AVF5_9CAUL|nr:tetratricopeptide repeat protein [Phenylobacterium deserti]RAK57544.1 hypothetical protein DJ018_06310 [Phenylobacterium deserti]
MTASRAKLEEAQACLRAGDAAQAAKLCEEVLGQEPEVLAALLILSASELALARTDEAVTAATRAVAAHPASAMAHHQLGLAYRAAGRLDQAALHLARAASSPNASALMHFDSAILQHQLGRNESALQSIDVALAQNPGWAAAYANRGVILRALGRPEAALDCYDKALALEPGPPQTRLNKANVLLQLERWTEADEAFASALAATPDSAAAHFGRGVARRRLGRLQQAAESFGAACASAPDWAEAHANLGVTFRELERHEDALASLAKALALCPDPDFLLSWLNVLSDVQGPEAALAEVQARLATAPEDPALLVAQGLWLQVVGQPPAALESFDRASERGALSGPARVSRGIALLSLRRFEEGWRDYEHRWDPPAFTPTVPGKMTHDLRRRLVRWPTAEVFRGRHVVLVSEQGVGDIIMFASIVPDVLGLARSVSIRCEGRLRGLLRASFPQLAAVGPEVSAAPDDLVVAIGSLGCAFRNHSAEFPRVAYLAAGAAARRRASEVLGRKDGRSRIALSWRGGARHTGVSRRSIPLELMRPLLELDDYEFVSLQYGDCRAELESVNATLRRPVRVLPPDLLNDFEGMAAVVQELDGVVSVQTALIHLAGAVGTPCRVMVPAAPEWRYGHSGARMPWYRSVQLVRQGEDLDWRPVVAEVVAQLSADAAELPIV